MSKPKLYKCKWKKRSCDVCGEKKNLHLLGTGKIELSVDDGAFVFKHYDTLCLRCGFVFNGKLPTQKFINDYYKRTLVRVAEDYRMENRLELIRELLKPGSKILEIGSGSGKFCNALNAADYKADGIEVNDSIPADKSYDLVLAYYVIEHVRKPRELIASISNALKPDGLLIVEVPSLLKYPRQAFYPEHLSHFTPYHLSTLLVMENFRVTRLITAHSRGFGFAIIAKRGMIDYMKKLYDGIEFKERINAKAD